MNIIKNKITNSIRKFLTRLIIKNHIYPSNIHKASNYIYTQDIEGDYLEFGCFRGESFIDAYYNIINAELYWQTEERGNKAFTNNNHKLEFYTKDYERRFIAFDSFVGLPKPDGIDKDHHLFREGRYDCSKGEFLKIIKNANLNIKKVKIVEGFFEDSLNYSIKKDLSIKKAAIIMIDCDFYKSTKLVLDFITNLLQNGTVIIFDDWFNYKSNPNKGEQRACKEWLQKNSHIKLIEYGNNQLTQKMFIVNLDN